MSDYDETAAKLAEEAMHADEISSNPPRLFGEVVTVDMWECVLVTGTGKVPFDPAKHDKAKRSIAITIEVQNIVNNVIKKKEWVHWSPAWKKITLPSIKAAGLDLSTMRGKFIASDYTPTGRTYLAKLPDGAPSGTPRETVPEYTFKFIESYDNREQCEAAKRMWDAGIDDDEMDEIASSIEASTGQADAGAVNGVAGGANGSQTPPTHHQSMQQAATSTGASNQATIANQAVKAMWKAAGEDFQRFSSMMGKNPKIKAQYPTAEAALAAIGAVGYAQLPEPPAS